MMKNDRHTSDEKCAAFTLIELLTVIAVVGILAAMLLPALARAKESGKRAYCLNNLSQLQLALQMYVDDNNEIFPPHVLTIRWSNRIYDDYGKNLKILLCPSETTNNPATLGDINVVADGAPRSYLMNGWNDYFRDVLGSDDFENLYLTEIYSNGLNEAVIVQPSDTIVFGEKQGGHGDFYMDMYQDAGDDFIGIVEQGRHSGRGPGTGGSNYSFADGSARFLKFGKSVDPISLWCITDSNRVANAIHY